MKRERKSLTKTEKKKKRKSSLTSWLLVLVMVVGIGIMAYPTISDRWNELHSSRAIASYSTNVEHADREELAAMIEAAKEYNDTLLEKNNPYLMTDRDIERYNSLLDLTGTGIIGYITIRSIGVYIPIYHGTDESVLQIAVGHINWTSLPVGGESSHAVLSGHRGLPSAKLFTDLDRMKEGDRFSITVLNQEISYEVDQIRIVEPEDVSPLGIEPGKDYCTLVTCTPYGINTHRLLIRGTRVANESGEMVVTPEAFRIPNYLAIPAVAIPLLFLFLLGMLIYYRVRRRRLKQDELYRIIREVTESAEEKVPAAEDNHPEPGQGEEPGQEETIPEEEAASGPEEGEDEEKRRDGS